MKAAADAFSFSVFVASIMYVDFYFTTILFYNTYVYLLKVSLQTKLNGMTFAFLRDSIVMHRHGRWLHFLHRAFVHHQTSVLHRPITNPILSQNPNFLLGLVLRGFVQSLGSPSRQVPVPLGLRSPSLDRIGVQGQGLVSVEPPASGPRQAPREGRRRLSRLRRRPRLGLGLFLGCC